MRGKQIAGVSVSGSSKLRATAQLARWFAPIGLGLLVVHCGSDSKEEPEPGRLSMNLSTHSNGVSYRLRDAWFDVIGPQSLTLSSEGYPYGYDYGATSNGDSSGCSSGLQGGACAQSLQQALAAGDYAVRLMDGWRLEQEFPTGFQTVAARVVSPNPTTFSIASGQTTSVAYVFETNGVTVDMTGGNLDLTIQVRIATAPGCTSDLDCRTPGASRCVNGQCQPCVNDSGGDHCGHILNGQLTLGVCDTSAGANAGVCVQCTGTNRSACGANVCNSLTKTCSPFAVGSATSCSDCVSDAHCPADSRCVLETFRGAELGYACFPLMVSGECASAPFSAVTLDIVSIDGDTRDACLLAFTTCAGISQTGSSPCIDARDCGEFGLDDGACNTRLGTCTVPCLSTSGCPMGFRCTAGACEPEL